MDRAKQHILLTGASGTIGKQLTVLLLNKGYQVSHLSRKPADSKYIKTFVWDVPKGVIDPKCIDEVDIIIHLAGAGVADKRWTDERKKELEDSRIKSIELIYDLLRREKHRVKKIVSASATGYYGDRGDELLTEDSTPANDFLARLCIDWENAVDEGKALGLKVLKFRTGVVLTKDGGALPKLVMPVKFGVGLPLGTGKQYIPWIHYHDVIDMYLYGVEQEDLTGVYNMVAPNSVTNTQMTKAVAKQLKRPLWLPNVPAVFLKLLLGEMSIIVLAGANISAKKIEQAGFKFSFSQIEGALKDIYE